eukprot:3881748-Pyramimonas_sp.AAC.1
MALTELDHRSRRSCADVWNQISSKTDQTKYRWQIVKGPMSATIAVLRDLGWQALSQVHWCTVESDLR